MVKIPDQLEALFTGSVEDNGSEYVVPVPKSMVESGSIEEDDQYKVALVNTNRGDQSLTSDGRVDSINEPNSPGAIQDRAHSGLDISGSKNGKSHEQYHQTHSKSDPPVSVDDIKDLEIESVGSEGDGVAKINNGFIVIVPGTQKGDHVRVRISEVKQNLAFATVLKHIH